MTLPRGPVAVVGLGLIGGSLARALVDAGTDVVGWDPDAQTMVAAADAGIRVVGSLEEACGTAPWLVVLAVPLVVVDQTARALAPLLGPDALVTDVGSVKGPVRDAMVAAGLGERFVGAHPMAGTEHSGFRSSDPELLRGARWAVTLDGTTPMTGFLAVVELVVDVLRGIVHPLSDGVHDEAAALISHVPHVVATELLNIVAHSTITDVAVGLAAGSFRDGTRVARTDPARTEAMIVENAGWVGPALRVAARDLERLAEALESNGPTGWFFSRGDALRSGGAEPGSQTLRTITLHPDEPWQAELVALGARGGRITGRGDDASLVVEDPGA
ncbi:prephenate dehydrogenase/arogenate dehydrogenase family protein [Sanguibacter sp. 25GB23B1]|uniref:prephenate dehydrogenase n=1 Tax=unclassified Sanguibacter TaxID=2645534 RepID=UPI0032AEA50D